MRILTLKLRWNQVEMLKKSLGSFFLIAAMLNISTITVLHSISSFSAGLILLFVSIYTTVFEENWTVSLYRIRGPLRLLRSSFWSKQSVWPLKGVCCFKTMALGIVKLLQLRLPSLWKKGRKGIVANLLLWPRSRGWAVCAAGVLLHQLLLGESFLNTLLHDENALIRNVLLNTSKKSVP